jgi:hypothetical protein
MRCMCVGGALVRSLLGGCRGGLGQAVCPSATEVRVSQGVWVSSCDEVCMWGGLGSLLKGCRGGLGQAVCPSATEVRALARARPRAPEASLHVQGLPCVLCVLCVLCCAFCACLPGPAGVRALSERGFVPWRAVRAANAARAVRVPRGVPRAEARAQGCACLALPASGPCFSVALCRGVLCVLQGVP